LADRIVDLGNGAQESNEQYGTPLNPLVLKPGDKIAQMVVVPFDSGVILVEYMSNLSSTERGDKGFGSSGKA
jgi:dUTPase